MSRIQISRCCNLAFGIPGGGVMATEKVRRRLHVTNEFVVGLAIHHRNQAPDAKPSIRDPDEQQCIA